MPFAIDPATGLPVDEFGNVVDPAVAGSNVVSEFNPPHIEMGEPEFIEMPPDVVQRPMEMEPDFIRPPQHIEFEQDDVPAAPSTPKVPRSASQSRSQSFRGVTDAGLKRSGDLFDRELTKVDPEIDRLEQQANADRYGMNRAYAKQRDSILEVGEQTRQYYEREAAMNDQLRDVQETAAELEAQAYAESKAERAQYISAYKEQLAAVKALAMQSGNPYAQMSGGEALGLAAAHFAQGFLAARGVQIDVAGQVDRWVDRSIREHQQKVQNMREGAQDQLHLYEIARQTSQDDWEARQRVRGFMIEGLKQKIIAEGSRFNSSIANAKAQEQVAKLDIEAQATEMAIGQRFEQQRFQQRQQAIDIAKHKGSLAIQQATLAETKRHNKAEENAKKNKDKSWSSKIADPFDVKRAKKGEKLPDGSIAKGGEVVSGGKLKWAVDTSAPDGIQSKAAEAISKSKTYYSNMRMGIDRLRELRAAAEPAMKGPEAYRMMDPAYREYAAQKTYLTEITQQAITGAAAPAEQAKRIQSWLADDDMLAFGTNEKLLENFNETLRQAQENVMNSTVGVRKLTAADFAEGESEYEDSAPVADPDRKLLYEAQSRGKLKGETADAEAMVSGAAHNKGAHDPSPMYYGYVRSKGVTSTAFGGVATKMANEMKAIDQLAIAMVRPETLISGTVEGQPAEDPNDLREQATHLLSDIAAGKPLSNGKPADKEVQAYARHVIEQGKELAWDEDAFYTRVASAVKVDDDSEDLDPAQAYERDAKPSKPLKGMKR